jgi:hypothetical protein
MLYKNCFGTIGLHFFMLFVFIFVYQYNLFYIILSRFLVCITVLFVANCFSIVSSLLRLWTLVQKMALIPWVLVWKMVTSVTLWKSLLFQTIVVLYLCTVLESLFAIWILHFKRKMISELFVKLNIFKL